MVHRISGLALACFLPLHFLTLGLAIEGEARLDGFLRWMDASAGQARRDGARVPAGGAHAGRHARAADRKHGLARGAEEAGVRARWRLPRWRRSRFSSARFENGSACSNGCKTDILILGSGGAGLFAALHAHQANPDLSITVATKGLLGKCGCTRMVQGGYNVALNPGDSIERHFMDTIEGGKWLPDQDLAWTLVTKAIERVRELENEIGCFFDRNADGTLHGKAFAGQTFDRTVHKGDLTGIEIINRLMEQVWARPIQRLEEHRAVALIPAKDGTSLAGVLMIDIRTGEFRFVQAKAPCCWRRAAGRPCTAITRRPATRAWTASPWRCAPACRCATWRWCSSIRPGCWPAPTRA